jgi:hypothetical protein
MNLSRELRPRLLKAAIVVVLTVTFFWVIWPFGKIVLFVLLPLLLLVLAIMFMPVKMSPAVRILTSIGVFGAFLVIRKVLASSALVRGLLAYQVGMGPPVPTIETVSLVIALLWLAGQMVLVVVTDRVRSGAAGVTESALAERGFAAFIRSTSRREFGAVPALWITGLRWGILILAGCLLLYRSGSLHQIEEDLILPVRHMSAVPGSSASVIVTLTTPDNNPRQYLRTALELNARFRAGGAAVVCFPSRGVLDSTARTLADSLAASGAVVFDREQFDPRYAMIGAGWDFLRFRSIDFSWTNGSPTVHPSLLAASRYLKLPVRIPPEYARFLHLDARAAGMVGPPRGEVMIGASRVPRWKDGMSVVLRRSAFLPLHYAAGGETLWNSFIFPANIERPQWEGPILYKEYGSGRTLTALPDSVWKFADGRMVFVQWVNMGDADFHDVASIPALIADMAVRGSFVREAPAWQVLVTLGVILIAVGLFALFRPWIVFIALLAGAIGLGVADAWIFCDYLLVTRLVYPVFAAAVAAMVLPLVRISLRR